MEEPTLLQIALEAADAGNAGHWPTVAGILADECRKLERENAWLRAAAQAVIDRWETPLWKDAEPTAAVIYRMRDILSNAKLTESSPK